MKIIVKNGEIFDTDIFVKETRDKLGIETNVNVLFKDNEDDTKNDTSFKEESITIVVGIKGYDLNSLDEHKKMKLCNTIYHEFVHVRDREKIKDIMPNSVLNSRNIAYFGYLILDELIAYSEANKEYPEKKEDLKTDLDKLLYIFFTHMTRGILYISPRFNKRSEDDEKLFFGAFYDYCSAIIVHYVVDGGFPDEKKYVPFNNAMNKLNSYRERHSSLTLADYEMLGQDFIESIIYDLSSSQSKNFWGNTGIIH